ncbi:MAG: hypothetical protein IPO26_14070 [Saprospiraceae bacterium]|nr:hypothetical protein [Saprospiraceae bacterium]
MEQSLGQLWKDGPTDGNEFLSKWPIPKSKMDFYIQYRYEKNKSTAATKISSTILKIKRYKGSDCTLDTRSIRNGKYATELSFPFSKKSKSSKGFLMYQDVIYKPTASPLRLQQGMPSSTLIVLMPESMLMKMISCTNFISLFFPKPRIEILYQYKIQNRQKLYLGIEIGPYIL